MSNYLIVSCIIINIVNKRRVVLTLGEAYNFLNSRIRPNKTDYISNQVLNEIEYYLDNNEVYPTVYIGYSRKAFFCRTDKNFRLTFDSKITTRRSGLSLELGNFGEQLLEEEQYLMEVKILGAIPLWFVEILSNLKNYKLHLM